MRGDNPAHVRLMTLLNVGAAVPSVEDVGTKTLGKRARAPGAARAPPAPRAEAKPKAARHAPADDAPAEEPAAALQVADDAEDEAPADAAADAFYAHFGADSAALEGVDLDQLAWRPAVRMHELGGALLSQPERTKEPESMQARVRTERAPDPLTRSHTLVSGRRLNRPSAGPARCSGSSCSAWGFTWICTTAVCRHTTTSLCAGRWQCTR